MMNNNIRYSRLPKCAYGTKMIPKYGVGTEEETTQGSGGGNFGDKVGNSFGWFAFANQAQTGARGMTAKKRVVNPKTGEVTEYQTTNEGQITEEIAQPYHEKYANDFKNKEYGGMAAQLVGGPVGQIAYNAIWGKKKKDAFNRGKEEEASTAQAEIDAQAEKERKAFEDKQRLDYSRAYIEQNPTMGQAGATIYAYGTKMNKIPRLAMGGDVTPIASNMGKAEGASHEQGGITLTNGNGEPTAEIEDKEVIVDDKSVLSNRLPFTGNISFAQKGESLAKEKAEHEHNLKAGDRISKNTSERHIEKIDAKVNTLLKYQDVVRKNMGLDGASPVNKYRWGTDYDGNPVWEDDNMTDKELYGQPTTMGMKGLDSPEPQLKGDLSLKEVPQYSNPGKTKRGGFDARGLGEGLQNAAPYMDNVINYGLIKETPKIPKPNKLEAFNETAMPMVTSYNINANLAANTEAQREFNRTVLDNTADSNTARGNLASGYARKIKGNNELYQQKINVENQLKNQDALNRQGVSNRNTKNAQDITNINKGLEDKYNWNNMLRDDSIRAQKSRLAAETTNDTTTLIQDDRMSKLDDKKILYDSLKYGDGAGLATMVDSPEIDNISKSKESRDKIRDTLKKSGQNAALKKYNKKYGLD